MGAFNEILAGRFNRFVQKHFSMKGREGTPTLSADVQMNMNFNSGAENRYLEGWDLFGFGVNNVVGSAGNTSLFRLRNPVGSGIVAVVTRALQSTAVADATIATSPVMVLVRGGTTDLPTIVSGGAWDLRGRPNASVIASHNNGAAGVPPGGTTVEMAQAVFAANTNYEWITPGLEIPLLPGTILQLSTGLLAQGASFACWWRERPLEDSEKF